MKKKTRTNWKKLHDAAEERAKRAECTLAMLEVQQQEVREFLGITTLLDRVGSIEMEVSDLRRVAT